MMKRRSKPAADQPAEKIAPAVEKFEIIERKPEPEPAPDQTLFAIHCGSCSKTIGHAATPGDAHTIASAHHSKNHPLEIPS
jgi:hypothetical protein